MLDIAYDGQNVCRGLSKLHLSKIWSHFTEHVLTLICELWYFKRYFVTLQYRCQRYRSKNFKYDHNLTTLFYQIIAANSWLLFTKQKRHFWRKSKTRIVFQESLYKICTCWLNNCMKKCISRKIPVRTHSRTKFNKKIPQIWFMNFTKCMQFPLKKKRKDIAVFAFSSNP